MARPTDSALRRRTLQTPWAGVRGGGSGRSPSWSAVSERTAVPGHEVTLHCQCCVYARAVGGVLAPAELMETQHI